MLFFVVVAAAADTLCVGAVVVFAWRVIVVLLGFFA